MADGRFVSTHVRSSKQRMLPQTSQSTTQRRTTIKQYARQLITCKSAILDKRRSRETNIYPRRQCNIPDCLSQYQPKELQRIRILIQSHNNCYILSAYHSSHTYSPHSNQDQSEHSSHYADTFVGLSQSFASMQPAHLHGTQAQRIHYTWLSCLHYLAM
jgi:hypothetical protein